MQNYLIDQRQEGGEWRFVAEVEARSASEAAVLTHGKVYDRPGGPFVWISEPLRSTQAGDRVMDSNGVQFEVRPNVAALAKLAAESDKGVLPLDVRCTGRAVQKASSETWELFVPHPHDKSFFRPWGIVQALSPQHAACLFVYTGEQAEAGWLLVNDDSCVWEITNDRPPRVAYAPEYIEAFQSYRPVVNELERGLER